MAAENTSLLDKKARDILGHLTNLLQEGWEALLVGKYIDDAMRSGKIKSTFFFFNTSKRSCLEAALLALSKAIIPHDDSISVHYLLNYAEQNYRVFSRADRETIISCIGEHRKQLDAISSIIANVKEQRDHTLAHLDKKHLVNPSSLNNKNPLLFVEVENSFELILKIINTYFGYLDPSNDFRLHSIDSLIAQDCDYLVNLFEKDNARKRINAG